MSEDNEFNPENLKVIKLSSGDTILAYITKVDQEHQVLLVQSPYRVITTYDTQYGETQSFLTQYFEMANNPGIHAVGFPHVVTMSTADKEACSQFVEHFQLDLEAEKMKDIEDAYETDNGNVSLAWDNQDEPEQSDKKADLKLIKDDDGPTYH